MTCKLCVHFIPGLENLLLKRLEVAFGAGKVGLKGRVRPEATSRHPIQKADIRGHMLYSFVPHESDRPYAHGGSFFFPVIFPCARLLLLNSNLQNMLSGIPMLCGRTVALKQS